MDLREVCANLTKKGYGVHCFDTPDQAATYLQGQLTHKTVGFGDSQTLVACNLFATLSQTNTVYDPQQATDHPTFIALAKQAMGAEIFITSCNAISAQGALVNLDGTGNRVAGSLFGHETVYFIVGRNKIVPTLDDAIHRTRNVAAPANARRLGLNTPCTVGAPQCHNCNSPQRICNGLVVHLNKMEGMAMDVLFIDQPLGL